MPPNFFTLVKQIFLLVIGPIVTMETIAIRLDRLHWDGPDVEADQTQWPMTPKQHIFFFTRIFYLFECPAYEQVGMYKLSSDFIPQSYLLLGTLNV